MVVHVGRVEDMNGIECDVQTHGAHHTSSFQYSGNLWLGRTFIQIYLDILFRFLSITWTMNFSTRSRQTYPASSVVPSRTRFTLNPPPIYGTSVSFLKTSNISKLHSTVNTGLVGEPVIDSEASKLDTPLVLPCFEFPTLFLVPAGSGDYEDYENIFLKEIVLLLKKLYSWWLCDSSLLKSRLRENRSNCCFQRWFQQPDSAMLQPARPKLSTLIS